MLATVALRWQDLVVIGISLCAVLAIGALSAQRSKSAEGYFLAGRSIPGWVLGFSMMSTIVSSMTFLALPATTYEFNWWQFPGNSTYIIAVVAALVLFVPFYRKAKLSSAYEYLELRFGTWARLYAAICFLMFHVVRMGIILYVVGLAVQASLGSGLIPILLILGTLVAVYTIVGGLQAVIWTDLFQGIALIGGGLVCLPIITSQLPEGFGQIIEVGRAENKFSWVSSQTDQQSTWAVICSKIVMYLMMVGTDQTSVQRYSAARTDKEARRGPRWSARCSSVDIFLLHRNRSLRLLQSNPRSHDGGAKDGSDLRSLHSDSAARRVDRTCDRRATGCGTLDARFQHQCLCGNGYQ